MSQAVVWTSECKAISLSVPPTPPHLISSIPKQQLLHWEKCSATYVCVEPKPACKQTLWWSSCLYTRYRSLQLQPDSMRDDWFVQINKSKTKCTQKLSPPKHSSQNFHKNQQEIKLNCTCRSQRAVFITKALIWLLGMSVFPQWVPTGRANSLLSRFQMDFSWKPPPHQSSQWRRQFLPRGQADLRMRIPFQRQVEGLKSCHHLSIKDWLKKPFIKGLRPKYKPGKGSLQEICVVKSIV